MWPEWFLSSNLPDCVKCMGIQHLNVNGYMQQMKKKGVSEGLMITHIYQQKGNCGKNTYNINTKPVGHGFG